MIWEMWKKGFDVWEDATAKYLEQVFKSPLVLAPTGFGLTAFMKAKAAGDQQLNRFWERVGLPNRRDQERALHALNQLESKLLDLEERLGD